MERNNNFFKYILTCLIICKISFSFAQTDKKKYLVLLKDKANTSYSLNNPSQFLSPRSVQRRLKQNIPLVERDLPVNKAYVASIQQTGAQVWYTSRWLNAVMVETDAITLPAILKLPFVKGLEGEYALGKSRQTGGILSGGLTTNKIIHSDKKASRRKSAKADAIPLLYGPSVDQVAMIGADKMHEKGYHGEGMLIAVLDAGFRNIDNLSHFQSLFAENRLVSTYDFVRKEASVFEDDSHGAQVLGTMAGFLEGRLIGTAYKANYILLRTEDVYSETRVEEANWLLGVEYADSAGVDVINSSLGYSTFDDPAQDYRYADLNGNKTLITRAADWAASTGMLVINSAGNEGGNGWQYITPPADADSIIAVASVNKDRIRASSSSKGPSVDHRVKPDLAALGQGAVVSTGPNGALTSSGTSFSAPVLAGMAAGFWQAFPQLTNMQVIDYLKRSGSQYLMPDSLLGYGIPNFVKASTLVGLQKNLDRSPFVFPNPFSNGLDPQVWLGNFPKSGFYTAVLSDMTGKLLWSGSFTNELNSLPVSTLALASGYYILKVVSASGASFSTKLLKN